MITYQDDEQANAGYAKELLDAPTKVLVEKRYTRRPTMTMPGQDSRRKLVTLTQVAGLLRPW